MKIDPTLYVRIGTAAAIAGVSTLWMRTKVQTGAIKGIEIDGQWFALRSAVDAYQRTDAGRPRLDRAAKAVAPAPAAEPSAKPRRRKS